MDTKIVCMTLGLLVAAASVAGAQEAAKKASTTTIAAGATATSGNTDQLVGNASIVNFRDDGVKSLRLGAEMTYAEINSDVTNEAWKAYANYKRVISDRLYGVGNLTYLHDKIADVQWRYTASPGLGYYLMKDANATLGVDAGPAYVWEKVAGVKDDYLALRFAERYDRTLSDTSKCWQSLEYMPRADDFNDYILNAEIGVEAVLAGPLSIRLVAQDSYDNTPAPGKKENDLKVIGALAYTL